MCHWNKINCERSSDYGNPMNLAAQTTWLGALFTIMTNTTVNWGWLAQSWCHMTGWSPIIGRRISQLITGTQYTQRLKSRYYQDRRITFDQTRTLPANLFGCNFYDTLWTSKQAEFLQCCWILRIMVFLQIGCRGAAFIMRFICVKYYAWIMSIISSTHCSL